MDHKEGQEENTLGMQDVENNYWKHGNNHIYLFSFEGRKDIKHDYISDLLRSTAQINSDAGAQFLPEIQSKAKT